ncbi:MAG: transposase [Pseudomonadota bacterium]|nr:transposase [Pseudomonadota bacterium]
MRLFAAFSTLTTVFDGGYTDKLIDWIKARWIVERTFAWLNHLRGLTQDHEVLPHPSETFITITMTYLTLPRFA